MTIKTLLSWSTGKDSAWTLYTLRQNRKTEVVGLLTTINQVYERVAMHAVRLKLLQAQAEAAGLPLLLINIPYPCSNQEYEAAMYKAINQAKEQGVEEIAFGDLFLQDIRAYREAKMEGTGINPTFPIWGIDTKLLAKEIINSGLRAVVTCVDPKKLDRSFAGREYNQNFLNDLPEGIDPCGEHGEFHTFAYDGPMFKSPVLIEVGEIVERDGFIFADILPAGSSI
jgi:uncharacterized protein (TIGR00290 family)